MKKTFNLQLIGFIYIILALLAFFFAFYYQRSESIFWFCYTGLLLIGLGILYEEKSLIQSQLYILFIPDVIWAIDFISYLVQGRSIFGISDYFFTEYPIVPKIITLQHLLTIPLAIFISSQNKLKNDKSWMISFIYILIFFIITKLFTSPSSNINCVYKMCGELIPFSISETFYPAVWFTFGFFMIYTTKIILSQVSKD